MNNNFSIFQDQNQTLNIKDEFDHSTYSLVLSENKSDDDCDHQHRFSKASLYPTDDDNDFQRSHSSSLNSSSYLSLYSRKPSLAKSSNTLFERSYITLTYSSKKSRSFIRFGSINEDTEYICNTKSKHQTILKQTSIDESSLSSAHQQSESCQLFTTSAEVNFNSLTMPSALSRKPSITFNETVFVFRSERRNSSPGMYFVLIEFKLQGVYFQVQVYALKLR